MERVAVWVSEYDIDYSPSILNLLDCLARHSQVDLYLSRVWARSSPVLSRPGIEVIVIREPATPRRLVRSARSALRRCLRAVVQARVADLRPANRRHLTASAAAELARRRRYSIHVCLDPHGLLLCTGLLPQARPVYYSLELYLEEDLLRSQHPEPVLRDLRAMIAQERQVADRIVGLVIQSEERASLLIADRGLRPELPVLTLPVTYQGPAVAEKSTALHAALGLDPETTRIALHLGGMNDWFSSIEIAREFASVAGWDLFFQGNHRREYLARFRRVMREEKIGGVHVSRRFYDDLTDLEPILASCQVGIAWYNDISKNLATAGRSSGKIAAYLRFGLPVLAKRYRSTAEAIEGPGCGVCVDEVREIPEAMCRLEREMEVMSRRCREEYERHYWFRAYEQQLLGFLSARSAEVTSP